MAKEKYCDLHVHSNCSDGSEDPAALIDIAERAGLSAVALTDHNTVAGLDRFEAAARGSGVIPVPGIEVTADFMGAEVHIVGLFVKKEAHAPLTSYLDQMTARKRRANEDMVKRLTAAGYEIDYGAVLADAGEAIPNRVHVARALIERGYVASVDEAFQNLLSEAAGFYQPAERLDAFDVIAFLRSQQILPLLAHPFLSLTPEMLCAFLPAAGSVGLVGVETRYPGFTPRQIEIAATLALQHGLLESGGSDFHGANRPEIAMGRGAGSLAVPHSFFEALMAYKLSLGY